MKTWRVFCCILLFALILSSCGSTDHSGSSFSSGTGVPIDLSFDPLIQKMGEDMAGGGIAYAFWKEGVLYQYTTYVLLVYSPEAPAKERYTLYPLGYEWDVSSPPVPDPQDPAEIYINGHIVWDEVVPIYRRLGSDLIGLPLSEVHYNPEKKRFEQFFEKMGFYRNEDDPEGKVWPMPYGLWYCGNSCKNSPSVKDSVPKSWPKSSTSPEVLRQAEAAFWAEVEVLGMQFTGFPLTSAAQVESGYVVKVFENVVMMWNPERPGEVEFDRLPQKAGLPPEPPVPPKEGLVFVPVAGELGYNIPSQFMDYISNHGTLERSGNPITELKPYGVGVLRQCFENFCLLYDQAAPQSLRIRLQPLGYQYKYSIESTPGLESAPQPQTPAQISPSSLVKLQIWENSPLLPADEHQVIGVAIFDGINPLRGAQFVATIFMPDGTQQAYSMPLTGDDGETEVELDLIEAPKGTVIDYQVCLVNLPSTQFCSSESFVIWDDNQN